MASLHCHIVIIHKATVLLKGTANHSMVRINDKHLQIIAKEITYNLFYFTVVTVIYVIILHQGDIASTDSTVWVVNVYATATYITIFYSYMKHLSLKLTFVLITLLYH